MEEKNLNNRQAKQLFEAILKLKDLDECERFFRDICTIKELEEMTSRFRIAQMLNEVKPKSYLEIAKEVGASTTTVTRVAHWLHHGMGGYQLILKRLAR